MATIGSVTKRDDGRYEGELRTLVAAHVRREVTDNGITDFFAQRVRTQELCVDDVCVTRDQFAEVFGNQSAAAGVSADGQLLEAPAAMPASAEADDIGETSSSTPSDIVPITSVPANDNPQPQGAEQSSHDDNEPIAEDATDTQLVEGTAQEEAAEPAPLPEPALEAANDNSPAPSAEAI